MCWFNLILMNIRNLKRLDIFPNLSEVAYIYELCAMPRQWVADNYVKSKTDYPLFDSE